MMFDACSYWDTLRFEVRCNDNLEPNRFGAAPLLSMCNGPNTGYKQPIRGIIYDLEQTAAEVRSIRTIALEYHNTMDTTTQWVGAPCHRPHDARAVYAPSAPTSPPAPSVPTSPLAPRARHCHLHCPPRPAARTARDAGAAIAAHLPGVKEG